MGKKSFISYLKKNSPENSGKPTSYAKAMEVIETTFFTKALSSQIDVWEFFPNDYDSFLEGHHNQHNPKLFTFPQLSSAEKSNLPKIDNDDKQSKSVMFLKEINDILKNPPFELAYRALNELLLSVACFSPKTRENCWQYGMTF